MNDRLAQIEAGAKAVLGDLPQTHRMLPVAGVLALVEIAKAARHPEIKHDLLWMAEGRSKADRKHVDDLFAALSVLDDREAGEPHD